MNMSPCKDCPDRYPACHGHCEKYQEWKAELDRIKNAARMQSSLAWTAGKRRAKWAYLKNDHSGAFKKFSS